MDPAGSNADERRLRRERELASLYATARSLTALGEVDEVLAAIVKHAHELMGVDLTYLSVLDGEHLRLRASEGTVSAAFTSAEVMSSTGIGGRVIENRAPFWVSDYLSEASIEHSSSFDELVAEEGLRALLGVPLLAADRVLGVLYVADRVERPYAPDEVALLSALADHASLALQNARLYEESRVALAQLQDAYQAIERSAQVHEALGRVVLTGGGEAEVAALLHEALGGRVMVVDRHDVVVGLRTDSDDEVDQVQPVHWHEDLLVSRREGRSVLESRGGGWQTVTAISAGDTYLGAVVWWHRSRPTDLDVRTVERASHILGLLALKQDAVVQAEERLRGEILTELIRASTPLPAELVSRGRALHVDVAAFNALLVVETEAEGAVDAHRSLAVAARDWSGLVGVYAGRATVTLHSDDLALTVRSLHRAVRASMRTPVLVCGIGVDGQSGGFSRAFSLASRCARVLRLAGVDDVGTTTTENGMYAALFDPERGEELDAFLEANLSALVLHDSKNKTALVQTLSAYFANSGNVARTARAMHVHTNTLLKRLDRVSSILGPQWSDPHRALPLQLALRLHVLRGDLGE